MSRDLDVAILTRDPDSGDICRERLVVNQIPQTLHSGLVRYLVDGLRPGSFLCAVLENDLREAVVRANPEEHLLALPALVRFLFNETPAQCHGGAEAVRVWCGQRGSMKQVAERG